jgi:ribosomal-protein-alanine N-acetyltransferase
MDEGSTTVPVMLETERLVLRNWDLDDAAGAFTIYGDPEVTRFLRGPARDLEAVREILRRNVDRQTRRGFAMWATVEKPTGRLVGSCGLQYLDGGPEVEVGYHLARAAWGRGYATEAARACVCYGFDHLNLARVVGIADPRNLASQRVLEKAGLTYERMDRYYDTEVKLYGIVRHAATSSSG